MSEPVFWGLVPAAGAGTRFGGPKALARRDDGTPWVALAVDMLRAAGCAEVLVVLGASADAATALVPAAAVVVREPGWAGGLSVSLRRGLAVAADGPAAALLVSPVDTPDAPVMAARRILSSAPDDLASALVQARYDGRPGHPVLLGRDHWRPLAETMTADAGARPYLRAHGVDEVECGDLWSGADVDRPR